MKFAVFHNLPSGGALWALAQKLKGLKQRAHSVELYLPSSAEMNFFPEVFSDFPRQVFDVISFSEKGFLEFYQGIAERINASDCDLVYVDKCRWFGTPPLICFLSKPSLYYMHEPLGVAEYESKIPGDLGSPDLFLKKIRNLRWPQVVSKTLSFSRRQMIKKWDRRAAKAATGVLTCSRFAAKWIHRVYGINAQVLYQGVDDDLVAGTVFTAQAKKHFLCVGRLEERKNHEFAIEVVSMLEEKFKLVILYDDASQACMDQLQDLARRKGVDLDLVFRPSRQEIGRYYRESIAVLCPARNEPFGLVPLEAMACAAPVIAADEGGYRETVKDGQTGLLLPRDPRLWAKRIDALLKNRDLCQKLGEAGRQDILEHWGWGRHSQAFLEIAKEVVKSRA